MLHLAISELKELARSKHSSLFGRQDITTLSIMTVSITINTRQSAKRPSAQKLFENNKKAEKARKGQTN